MTPLLGLGQCHPGQGNTFGDGRCGENEDCFTCPEDCRQKSTGKLANRYCCDGNLVVDEFQFDVEIKTGWNKVLSAVTNDASTWELEYRFTFRAMEHADFIEGIRAAITDKDRNPQWKHTLDDAIEMAVTNMLLPLGADTLKL